MTDNTSVKVIVRIRPLVHRDRIDCCHVCTTVTPNEPQIWLGKDKAFTFDGVFDMCSDQEEIFNSFVRNLVDGVFDGYNATVLAYGQTGSGKTYTMGTGFDLNYHEADRGIVPRAIEHLFQKIATIQREAKQEGSSIPEFKINVQFMELYNEEINDLLDTTRDLNQKKRARVKIHEYSDGGIYTHGVIAQCVTTAEEALECLKIGSLSRTTASTNMNAQSSRSHAVFTLHIKQQRVVKLGKAISGDTTCNSTQHEHTESLNEFETLTAKFHFVDLAGSERLKRTRATGTRRREGISINSGLLSLGNVISALGDKSKKATHIPYRDTKLTRLLQDSLGGNSMTLMIACVSPSDRDFMETLNTLKYANRAKNIKNKVSANKDKSSETISMLLQKVADLQLELMEFQQGKKIIGDDGSICINDMYHENTMLQSEINVLKTRVKALLETIERLTVKNSELLVEKQSGLWISNEESQSDISSLVLQYVTEIESLRAQLMEYEEVCAFQRKNVYKSPPRPNSSPTSTVAVTGHYDIRVDASPSVYELIEEAKEDVRKLKQRKKKLKESSQDKENSIKISDEDKETAESENISEDESSTESEGEITEAEANFSEDLADLTCEISLKQKLIEQLEMSQKRLYNMRQHYEDKICQLQSKIEETETERNQVLANLNKSTETHSIEKVKRVREDFERKLNALKNDVKNMQAAKKEHAQLMKNQADYEKQMKKLKQEVAEMRKAKDVLLKKMKEENKKHKNDDLKRSKEIAQLRKEKVNKDSRIKALEAETRHKDTILKRRSEEIMNLKKKPSKLSPRMNGQLRSGTFSPKLAKQKWQNLEKKITKLVLNKQSVAAVEKDMERWLHEREKLSRCLEKVLRKRDRALMERKSSEVIGELENEIENLKANIEYIHENLSDCQTSIMQMEEAKEGIDSADINSTLKNTRLEEYRYLIEKLLNMAINQSFQAAHKGLEVKELEAELKQVVENNAVQEQLLLHVVHQANEHISGFIELSAAAEEAERNRSNSSSRSSSPVDSSMPSISREQTFVMDDTKKRKARKVAATTEQLLFSSEPMLDGDLFNIESDKDPLQILYPQPVNAIISGNGTLADNKSLSYVILPAIDQNREAEGEWSCTGHVLPFTEAQQDPPLVCTHVAEGHLRPVRCVECTEDVLFTGSDDRSVKVWDLSCGAEIQCLSGHPAPVRRVRYSEYTRLAFTASAAAVKVWDVRQRPTCVRTLWASGRQGHPEGSEGPKSVSEEHHVNDIALNHYGTILFSAFTGAVRVWDLRMFQSIGSLNVGYQCSVSCLAVDDFEIDKSLVVCGSQDNSLKVFEVSGGIHSANFSLAPPHYDSVCALALSGDFLYSGGRDMAIKKWDLRKRCVEHVQYRAHREAVQALALFDGGALLASGDRSGALKLWACDRCSALAERRAHRAPINALASKRDLLFTASEDCTVGIWKLSSSSTQSRGDP